MSTTTTKPSPRAKAIAEGLVKSGRAAKFQLAGKFLRVDGAGATHWVATDGWRLLRGVLLDRSVELQAGFLEAMLVAGSAQL